MFAWTQLTQVQDPLRVEEAKATKLSVTKAVEWGTYNHVICEGDTLNVIL